MEDKLHYKDIATMYGLGMISQKEFERWVLSPYVYPLPRLIKQEDQDEERNNLSVP